MFRADAVERDSESGNQKRVQVAGHDKSLAGSSACFRLRQGLAHALACFILKLKARRRKRRSALRSGRSSRISTRGSERKHVDHAGSRGIGRRCATRQDLLLRTAGSGRPNGQKPEYFFGVTGQLPTLGLFSRGANVPNAVSCRFAGDRGAARSSPSLPETNLSRRQIAPTRIVRRRLGSPRCAPQRFECGWALYRLAPGLIGFCAPGPYGERRPRRPPDRSG